jgi:processive 1,2-diacylglycerol beta-glucosyltransferase
MIRILALYANAGHGHRKAAEAVLEEVLDGQHKNISREVKDALNYTPASFRYCYPRVYYWMVKRAPWLWGLFFYGTDLAWLYPIIRPIRSFWNRIQSFGLRSYLKNENFDVILFTHFFPAEVCAAMKRKKELASTLITIVTDVIPHHVWQNPGTDHYWVMGKESQAALVKMGEPQERVHVEGIPISRKFLKQRRKADMRKNLGLEQNRFTLLFTSGSFGLGKTEAILESLSPLQGTLQTIVVCGNNDALRAKLKSNQYPFPALILGFVDNMDELMSASDLMIAKAGGITTCESLALNLPIAISESIPGQETGNATWLLERGVAVELSGPSAAVDLVTKFSSNQEVISQVKRNILGAAKPRSAKTLIEFILKNKGRKNS